MIKLNGAFDVLDAETKLEIAKPLNKFWDSKKDKYFDEGGNKLVNLRDDDIVSVLSKEFLWYFNSLYKTTKGTMKEDKYSTFLDWYFSLDGQYNTKTYISQMVKEIHKKKKEEEKITEKQVKYLNFLLYKCKGISLTIPASSISKKDASTVIDFLKSKADGKDVQVPDKISKLIKGGK